ncbi:hypothetical protein [Dyella sp. 2RAB6]|uniref:hypothetical protein n=1 Tax=Dyella sp. 2RAB6 TaxID=3232992 RepID=UPI003F908758
MSKPFASLIAALITICVSACAIAASDPGDNPAFHRIKHIDSFIPPAGLLKDHLDTLVGKAKAGDDHAATLLYASLAACSSAKLADDNSTYSATCKDISQQQLDGRAAWLRLAAGHGYAPARYIYASSGAEEALGSSAYVLEHPEAAEAYLSTARHYLEALANECNIDAIGMIAFHAGKTDGLMYGDDPETAYKYEVITNKLLSTHSPVQPRIEARIAPQRVFALQSEATAFVTERCK